MQKLKVLVLGSGGQLGKELKYNLTKNVSTIFFDKEKLDITNYDLLKNKINNFDPSIIINAAAFTNVNKAEENKKEAFSVNSDAVGFLSNLIAKKDIWLIHFSTDYVFDGKKNLKYEESDLTKPLNIYGMSKLSGEKKIIQSCCKHIIFRTSWVYGEYGYNFIKKIFNIAKTKQKISVVSDQKGVPTSTYLICRIINKLIQDISMDNFWTPGIYHLVPNGRTTWFEMAQEVAGELSDLREDMEDTQTLDLYSQSVQTTKRRAMRFVDGEIGEKDDEDDEDELKNVDKRYKTRDGYLRDGFTV